MSLMQLWQVMGTAKTVSKTGTVILRVFVGPKIEKRKNCVADEDMSKLWVLDLVALKSPALLPNTDDT